MNSYKITATQSGGSDMPVADPWGNNLHRGMSAEGAWDAYLRVLDRFECVPGWLCLTTSFARFMDGEPVTINGVTLTTVTGPTRLSRSVAAKCDCGCFPRSQMAGHLPNCGVYA